MVREQLSILLQRSQYKILSNYKKVADEERPKTSFSYTIPDTQAKQKLEISQDESRDRAIYIGLGTVKCAKGSCYFELGETKVLSTVSYPKQYLGSSKNQLNFEFKFAPFSMRTYSRNKQMKIEQMYSNFMKKALTSAICLDQLNCNVTISTLVLENDGSVLSSAILSASLALANGGFEIYSLVTSVTIGIHDGVHFINPTFDEEEACKIAYLAKDSYNQNNAIMVVSKTHTWEAFSQVYSQGNLSADFYNETLNLVTEQCDKLFNIVQESLLQFADKSSQIT